MTASASRLTGDVVGAGDPRYEVARTGWNHLYSRYPKAIVFCSNTTDVVNALEWAQHNDVAVRARSGGHCLEGWSAVDGGLVIDVSGLKSAQIDAVSGRATVGAGLLQLEAVTALGAHGLAAPTGTEGTVGLVGATLGGGFGLLTRSLGMASDNLMAVEIVVTDKGNGAKAITVDDTSHPDLMWALRGAGNGNFGVVTSLTYQVHPLSHVTYVVATWAGLSDLPEVFDAWQHSAPNTDSRLTSQLEIHCGEIQLIAALCAGSGTEATELLAPILTVGNPRITTTTAPWADTYADFQIPTPEEPANWKFTSQFIIRPFPAAAIELISRFMDKAPSPDCNYFTNAFGGAVMTSEPAGGSVFAHRDALFYAEPGVGWGVRGGPAADEQLTARALAWIAEFSESLQPYVAGAYVNVPNAGMADWATAYWGDNLDRLRAVKSKYDPGNMFRYEQSIPPATR
ncbi:MAG: FAD-binding oxidoreductase [Actinomycetota bacterium]|uniref:FAD-binding oxidoreductase n=1 Tax=Mycobacterium lentiflavum TaxID=141349 RepID=A0ABY3UYB0_MYCLN|nr:FAD-binding oxidoreductase [Mycobacterium lentiflavum]MEE3064130.1 FAD-binding oxidoreductase [Actinomycetota bacterium]ULP42259.1 FAD-binding oxidoreductase [Mycobacterium lentiflavum]